MEKPGLGLGEASVQVLPICAGCVGGWVGGWGRGLCCPQWMATSVCLFPKGCRQDGSEASTAIQISLWFTQHVPLGDKWLQKSPCQKGCFLATGDPTWRLSSIVGHTARGEGCFSASAAQRNLWDTLPPRPVNQSSFQGWDTALALWKALQVISGVAQVENHWGRSCSCTVRAPVLPHVVSRLGSVNGQFQAWWQ